MGCVGSRVDIEANGRQYHIKRLIASGGFSQIFCAEDLETKDRVAIKRITCHSRSEMERTYREIEFHQKFGGRHSSQCNGTSDGDDDTKVQAKHFCSHIMSIIGICEEKMSNESSTHSIFSLVFPLCKLGSIQDELISRRSTKNYIDSERIMNLFRQVCLALEVLHTMKPPIAHRDLKPANLLLQNENHLVLTDFGSATECPVVIRDMKQRRLALDEASEFCTMPYRAPELFTCETGTVLDQSVDIWSLGCVLYAFCYFCSPYDEVHERGDSVALAVQSARIKFDVDAPIDPSINSLISSLIKFDPSGRPRISQILQRL